jgi:hypothetical protein
MAYMFAGMVSSTAKFYVLALLAARNAYSPANFFFVGNYDLCCPKQGWFFL